MSGREGTSGDSLSDAELNSGEKNILFTACGLRGVQTLLLLPVTFVLLSLGQTAGSRAGLLYNRLRVRVSSDAFHFSLISGVWFTEVIGL